MHRLLLVQMPVALSLMRQSDGQVPPVKPVARPVAVCTGRLDKQYNQLLVLPQIEKIERRQVMHFVRLARVAVLLAERAVNGLF